MNRMELHFLQIDFKIAQTGNFFIGDQLYQLEPMVDADTGRYKRQAGPGRLTRQPLYEVRPVPDDDDGQVTDVSCKLNYFFLGFIDFKLLSLPALTSQCRDTQFFHT